MSTHRTILGKRIWCKQDGKTMHSTEQGAPYCSCGQDAVTCQRCGEQVCGEFATWLDSDTPEHRKGNHCPECLAKLEIAAVPQTALQRTAREAQARRMLEEGRAKLDETLALTYGPEISIDFVARALAMQFSDQARGRWRELISAVNAYDKNQIGDTDLRTICSQITRLAHEVVENLDREERAWKAASAQ